MVPRSRLRLASTGGLPLVLTLSLVLAGTSHAQGGAGTVSILVRAADSGAPLVGALVSAAGVGIQGTTDRRGELRVTTLAPGPHALYARYLGYATTRAPVFVMDEGHVEVVLELPIQPIPLAEVSVTADRPLLERTGFRGRRSAGFGTFVTREQIVRMRPRLLSDVLRRVAGISLSPTRAGGMSRASIRGTKVMMGSCPVQYYVDGTMVGYYNLDEMPPDDVEGIEIYRGAATIPPAYNKGTALCGVVLIWTRDR